MLLSTIHRARRVRLMSLLTLFTIIVSSVVTAAPTPAHATGFTTNLAGPWVNYPTDPNSTWISTANGLQGSGNGDNVSTSATTAADGVLSAKITLSPNTTAGALMFRVQNQTTPWNAGYVVNINMTNGGQVKLFALPYREIAIRA